jgi:hypothetical protein
MKRGAAAWLAWSLWALCLGLAAFGLALFFLNESAARFLDDSVGVDLVIAVTYPTVGALIAARRPGNAIGWIFCAIGLSEAVAVFTGEYATYALVTRPGALPAGLAMAWLSTWIWLPGIGLAATFLLLLFPDGRLPSRRWRPVAWSAAVVLAIGSVTLALSPWELLGDFAPYTNPLGLAGAANLSPALYVGLLALGTVISLCCLVAVILRFHRARGEERQQLKWFTYAGALYIAVLLPLEGMTAALQLLVHPFLPIAVGIAVLRHRLYDIDIIIKRTLVYGLLTGALAALYFGVVVLLQAGFRALAGQESDLAIVAATLAVAALFQPLRARLQAFIDRRFYRRKYDAARIMAAYGAALRQDAELEALSGELLRVADETMRPAHLSLWLRESDGRE